MDNTGVRVSIVIPCFNHGQYILDAIASVEACPNRNRWELIIVNDGSTDSYTCEVMQTLKDQGYHVIEQENLGLGAARNAGITVAKGDYILPLDSDNKIRPGYIDKGIETLDQDPEVGVVYGNAEYFGERSGIWQMPKFDLSLLLVKNLVDACAVFRRSIWQHFPYETHPDLRGCEDWDLWISTAKAGWKFHHIPEILFDYRVRSDSMVVTSRLPENSSKIGRYIAQKHCDLYRAEYCKLYLEMSDIRLFMNRTYIHYFYQACQGFYKKFKQRNKLKSI